LAGLARKNALDELEFLVRIAKAVTVGKIECLAVDFERLWLMVNDNAALFFKIAIFPDVVVSSEEMHLYASVGEFGYLAEKARVALWHDVLVLMPEIEHIAQEIHGRCLCLNLIEKTHETAFLSA
jgi:hypothetical protein